MKKLLLVFAVAVAAVAVPAATAGGWATVGLSSLPPAGLPANEDWPVDITVLQHGKTPLAGVTPIVRIRDDGGNVVKTFTAAPDSRMNIAITGAQSDVPELADEEFSVVLDATQPIVVERSIYSDAGGVVWAAGTNAAATRLP